MASLNTSKVDGNTVSASEWNQFASINNFITNSGQTPSSSNLQQMGIASARYSSAGQHFEDTSAGANAYILSPVSPFKSPVSSTAGEGYFTGMRITFKTANANTGASTVNVNSLGTKSLKKSDGSTDVATGDIPAGQYVTFIYNGTHFVKQNQTPATSTSQGIVYLPNPISFTNDTTDANNDMVFTQGVINYDDGSGQSVSSLNLIKRLDENFAQGTDAGGLDTSTKANSTWYNIFAITKNDTGVVDFLYSTSRTSPTIPSGWTRRAWLGAIRTNASGNIDQNYSARRTSYGQVVSFIETNVVTGSGAIPYDNNIPQSNQGAQYMELAINPISASSKLLINVIWSGSVNGAYDNTLALFKDSIANALKACQWNTNGANVSRNVPLFACENSGSTSLQTFKVRAGASTSIALAMNGVANASTRLYGGVSSSSIVIQEIL